MKERKAYIAWSTFRKNKKLSYTLYLKNYSRKDYYKIIDDFEDFRKNRGKLGFACRFLLWVQDQWDKIPFKEEPKEKKHGIIEKVSALFIGITALLFIIFFILIDMFIEAPIKMLYPYSYKPFKKRWK